MPIRRALGLLLLFWTVLAPRAWALSTVGFELDAFPFATGGYYASAWYGSSPFRYRAVVTETYPPDVAVGAGFNHLRLDVVALIADWFFGTKADESLDPARQFPVARKRRELVGDGAYLPSPVAHHAQEFRRGQVLVAGAERAMRDERGHGLRFGVLLY